MDTPETTTAPNSAPPAAPKAEAPKTKSQTLAADVSGLFRSRAPLLWVVTSEEARVEGYLFEAAAAASYIARTWDCGQGVCDINGQVDSAIGSRDIGDTLTAIGNRSGERGVWIMRDANSWLTGPGAMLTVRQLRNLCRSLPGKPRESANTIVVLTTSSEIPADLQGHATLIDWPLPDRDEIARTLDAAIASLPEKDEKGNPLRALAAPNGTRESAIDAAVGLSGLEAQACFAKSLVTLRRIDPAAVAKEKKRVVAKSGVLEWIDPIPGGLDAVGGLENLKSYLYSRKDAYTPEARAYGLPTPMGSLIVGWNGCGKSLTCKAISTAWGNPLIRVDLGAAKSKFVGDSEQAIRRAFDTINAIGRCVVWFDEIEKALSGATDGGADGGVSKDALGFILTWMQEKRGQAFCIATCNDATQLPPELMRRFDVTWWVDLPTPEERAQIIQAAMREHGRGKVQIDPNAVADVTHLFSGAEVAQLVPAALYTGFADGRREIRTADLIEAASHVVPGAKTNAEKLARMRAWAEGKARPATKTARKGDVPQGVALDL